MESKQANEVKLLEKESLVRSTVHSWYISDYFFFEDLTKDTPLLAC